MHFCGEVLLLGTGKRIFVAKCSSAERGSAFLWRSALPRNGEVHFCGEVLLLGAGSVHFAGEVLFRGAGKRIFVTKCSCSERGSAFF